MHNPTFWNQYGSLILSLVGMLVSGILTPLYQKIPANNWLLAIIKVVLAPFFNVAHIVPSGRAAKATLISFVALVLLSGCGFLGIGTKSPCDGLYCLSVTGQGVPGEALVCYSTQAQMLDAQQQYRAKGARAEVAK